MRIPNIKEKMLNLQLKDLQNEGNVKREVYAQVLPTWRITLSISERRLFHDGRNREMKRSLSVAKQYALKGSA